MKLLKKVCVLLLTLAIITGSILADNISNTYAASKNIKELTKGIIYKCDLDGDKKNDTIKVYESGDKLKIKVNNTTKTLISDFDKDAFNYNVKLYDFNKNDKSKEIVLSYAVDSTYGTKILKFKDNICKLYKSYDDAILNSYDSKSGMITFKEYDRGRYESFSKAIGCFCCYSKVRIDGCKVYNQYSAKTFGIVKNNEYVAAKNITVYSDKNCNKVKFKINKGSKIYITELYKNGNKKLIKVKSTEGKTGYVKIGTKLLFTKKSCVWAR